MNQKIITLFGFLFLFIGIIQSVIFNEAHYYSAFSVGMVILTLQLYIWYTKTNPFTGWKFKNYFIYSVLLTLFAIILDYFAIYEFYYWWYPDYYTIFDWIIQKFFEFSLSLVYFQLMFMLGIKYFENKQFSLISSMILSLLTFSILIGFWTDYFNNFANSWEVLAMPFTNYKIGSYFLVFHTVGYWLLPIVSYVIYKISKNKYV
jgi:hypothetical protein